MTLRILYSFPAEVMSGRSGAIVLVNRGGNGYFRKFTQPSNPQTVGQESVRQFQTNASTAWAALTRTEQNGWDDFANLIYPDPEPPALSKMTGFMAFQKVSFYAQLSGNPLPTAAPSTGKPFPVTAMVPLTSTPMNTFAWTVGTFAPTEVNHLIYVRLTPQAPTGQQPLVDQLRSIIDVDVTSTPPMVANQATLTIAGARFSIANDALYRVEATVISPDFVPSNVFTKIQTRIQA